MSTHISSYHLKHYLPCFILMTILGLGVLAATFLSLNRQEIRNKAAAPEERVAFYLQPDSTTMTPNSSQSIKVFANPGILPIDGFQTIITISGTIPSDLNFTPNPSTIPAMHNLIADIVTVDNTPSIRVAYITSDPSTPYNAHGQLVLLGTITFTAPASGSLTTTFDTQLTKSTKNGTGENLATIPAPSSTYTFSAQPPTSPSNQPTSNPSPTTSTSPTPLPTTSSSPTPSPTSTTTSTHPVTLRVKFRGVKKDVGPIKAKVSWSNDDNESDTIPAVTFLHTSSGVYQATVDLGTSPGPYAIAIKGEKHLQHVFRNINIPTNNNIDLTSYPLEPGDLPISGIQDGQVNTNDIDRVLAAMAKPNQTAADLTVADVNYDGVVNAGDMAQILATLSTKPDEVIN